MSAGVLLSWRTENQFSNLANPNRPYSEAPNFGLGLSRSLDALCCLCILFVFVISTGKTYVHDDPKPCIPTPSVEMPYPAIPEALKHIIVADASNAAGPRDCTRIPIAWNETIPHLCSTHNSSGVPAL